MQIFEWTLQMKAAALFDGNDAHEPREPADAACSHPLEDSIPRELNQKEPTAHYWVTLGRPSRHQHKGPVCNCMKR